MILDAYLKLSKMTKEKAASKLNISRPLLYKLLEEKKMICSPDSRKCNMKQQKVGKAIKDGSFWEYHTHSNSDTWQ